MDLARSSAEATGAPLIAGLAIGVDRLTGGFTEIGAGGSLIGGGFADSAVLSGLASICFNACSRRLIGRRPVGVGHAVTGWLPLGMLAAATQGGKKPLIFLPPHQCRACRLEGPHFSRIVLDDDEVVI